MQLRPAPLGNQVKIPSRSMMRVFGLRDRNPQTESERLRATASANQHGNFMSWACPSFKKKIAGNSALSLTDFSSSSLEDSSSSVLLSFSSSSDVSSSSSWLSAAPCCWKAAGVVGDLIEYVVVLLKLPSSLIRSP